MLYFDMKDEFADVLLCSCLSLGSIPEITEQDLTNGMVLESESPESEPQFFIFLGPVPMSKLVDLIKHYSCN